MKTGIIPILPLRSRRNASGPVRSDRRSSGRGRFLALLALGLAALPSAPLRAQTAPAEPAGQPEAAVPAPGKPWTLEACIRYAQQHNTEVQQRALEVERNDIELSTARYSRLPDLNASLGGDALVRPGAHERQHLPRQQPDFGIAERLGLDAALPGHAHQPPDQGREVRPRGRRAGPRTHPRGRGDQRHDALPPGALLQGSLVGVSRRQARTEHPPGRTQPGAGCRGQRARIGRL